MAISNPRLPALQVSLRPLRERLIAHPMYAQIRTLDGLRIFMEHHIYAVWDFMSLLKTLQRSLTCVEVPWMPAGDRVARRLINEIVLGEESDDDSGGFISHYEMYHEAMSACGADTSHIDRFLHMVRAGAGVPAALDLVAVPRPAAEFVRSTWDFIESGSPHIVAAAFTLGREDIIPDMFRALVADLCIRFPNQLIRFHTYLERHIQLDEEHHTPMALAMLEHLCGDDGRKWEESARAARLAIEARIRLWDGIVAAMRGRLAGDDVAEHAGANGSVEESSFTQYLAGRTLRRRAADLLLCIFPLNIFSGYLNLRVYPKTLFWPSRLYKPKNPRAQQRWTVQGDVLEFIENR